MKLRSWFKMKEQELIEKITKAVSFKYREDPTAPNVTISFLNNGYYCSIVRYTGAFSSGKKVLCKAQNASLEVALKDIANQFLLIAARSQNPLQELSELVWRENDSK